MSKNIQLTIADPCHENWENMTQAEKGRFCASCQKQVIDFTNMSDSQLAAFFKKPTEGSVCGRFFQDQLDRSIEIPKKRIPWVKYFFQFALPAFLFSMKATAQGKVKTKQVLNTQLSPNCLQLTGFVGFASVERKKLTGDTVVATVPRQNELSVLLQGKPKINREPVSSLVSIQGVVVDQDNNPVPFASVMIKGTKFGIMADGDGAFKIYKPAEQAAITLEVSCVGYEKKEKLLSKETGFSNDLVIQLNLVVREEVVVVAYPVMGALGVRRVVTSAKKEKEQPKEVEPMLSEEAKKALTNTSIIKSPSEDLAMIKVYPNPVASGTSINIGCQKLKEGYYYLQLSSQSGQQVLNKQTWIDGDVQVLNIDIPNVATGVYFLKLTSKETNKRFTQKIIVQ
jgi:hypothetical protein